ncbi:MAG: helix-hairpin-helix domain-containing protein [Deltaproteobacteria bacterium]|jgi:competence protein ComEA
MNYFSRSHALVILLVSFVLLSVYGWSYHDQYDSSGKSSQLSTKSVFVQLVGMVKSPGIYSFPQGVTVAQAVARAGGSLYPLDGPTWANVQTESGRRIQIIAEASGATSFKLGWMAVPTRLALGVPLDINQVSVAELSQVPGINYKLAKEVVALRGLRGTFSKLENLCEVKGIGPATVTRLRAYIKVGKED